MLCLKFRKSYVPLEIIFFVLSMLKTNTSFIHVNNNIQIKLDSTINVSLYTRIYKALGLGRCCEDKPYTPILKL